MSWDTPNYAVPGLMPVTSPKYEKALALSPETIFFEPCVEGDDWEGVPTIGPVLFNGTQPADALSKVRLIFFETLFTAPDLILTSESGIVVIEDAATWEISVPVVTAELFTLKAGTYKWVIETTDAAGVVRSLFKGILEVQDPRPA